MALIRMNIISTEVSSRKSRSDPTIAIENSGHEAVHQVTSEAKPPPKKKYEKFYEPANLHKRRDRNQ